MKVQVRSGDISKVSAAGLITAINSGGAWFGGIDGVIQRLAGDHFHDQVRRVKSLRDGLTVVAKGKRGGKSTAFENVVFVVDDLRQPLSKVINAGLKAASDAGLTSVTLPTIRMGVMLGVVEKTRDEALREMASGVHKFQTENPDTCIQSATFVVYNDPETEKCLARALEE